ncbi:MAG: hypothetical protein ACYC3I_20050 [Gemmataceae bacterium]
MPSTPLPCPPSHSSPPTLSASRLHGSAILASASVSFALVAGVFAWIATHPRPAALSPQATSVVTTADSIELTAEPLDPPTPPQALFIAATPAFHRLHPRDEIVSNIPTLKEAPPLPPPASPPAKRDTEAALVQAPPHPAGETYGTQVLFHNTQAAAANLARNEHKLLFVMHISGNFEDSCFT